MLYTISIFDALQSINYDINKLSFWSYVCAGIFILAGGYIIYTILKEKALIKEKEKASFNRKTFSKEKMKYKRHKIKNKFK